MNEFPHDESIAGRPLVLSLPRRVAFGAGVVGDVLPGELAGHGRRRRRVLFVTGKSTRGACDGLIATLLDGKGDDAKRADASLIDATFVYGEVPAEPTIADFRAALSAARDARADAIVGLGGGSAMDVAKLVAALVDSTQEIGDAFGIGRLASRNAYLACVPTTAGTGSEVSPNAILLNEREQLKKGAISPHLMPDAAIVDPLLTLSVPRHVTGATGIDALTHCIEAYANKLAHPLVDPWAIEGIRLIGENLIAAYDDGADVAARTAMARGSLFGGFCLGPVNTGAIHALSYPLGGAFGVPHGVANALMMLPVLAFNLPAAPQRYAEIAFALGAELDPSDLLETARRGLDRLGELAVHCNIPLRLRDVGVAEKDIERLARGAMTVTRLLERNVRTVTYDDAVAIYRSAY